MLVVSRMKNESLVIGDSIIVTVIEVRGHVIDLEIKSPTDSVIVSCKKKEAASSGAILP